MSKSPRPLKLDIYGFPSRLQDSTQKIFDEKVIPSMQKTKSEWFQYIKSVGGSDNINVHSTTFKKMVRKGIPAEQRSILWCKMTNVFELVKENPNVYQTVLHTEGAIPDDVLEQIMLDVPRTFDGNTAFSQGQLLNVLKVFAVLHPEIGYCQSLNFLAGVLLSVLQSEETALWMLHTMIDKYFPKNYFTKSMADFAVDLCMMKMLLDERTPELAKHAQKMNYDWIQCTSSWLLTLYSNTLPMATVLRIWDSFFLEGPKIIFRVGIAILRYYYDVILSIQEPNKFPRGIVIIQENMVDQDALMEIAFSIKMFSKSHLFELRTEAKAAVAENGMDSPPKRKACLQSLFGQLRL